MIKIQKNIIDFLTNLVMENGGKIDEISFSIPDSMFKNLWLVRITSENFITHSEKNAALFPETIEIQNEKYAIFRN